MSPVTTIFMRRRPYSQRCHRSPSRQPARCRAPPESRRDPPVVIQCPRQAGRPVGARGGSSVARRVLDLGIARRSIRWAMAATPGPFSSTCSGSRGSALTTYYVEELAPGSSIDSEGQRTPFLASANARYFRDVVDRFALHEPREPARARRAGARRPVPPRGRASGPDIDLVRESVRRAAVAPAENARGECTSTSILATPRSGTSSTPSTWACATTIVYVTVGLNLGEPDCPLPDRRHPLEEDAAPRRARRMGRRRPHRRGPRTPRSRDGGDSRRSRGPGAGTSRSQPGSIPCSTCLATSTFPWSSAWTSTPQDRGCRDAARRRLRVARVRVEVGGACRAAVLVAEPAGAGDVEEEIGGPAKARDRLAAGAVERAVGNAHGEPLRGHVDQTERIDQPPDIAGRVVGERLARRVVEPLAGVLEVEHVAPEPAKAIHVCEIVPGDPAQRKARDEPGHHDPHGSAGAGSRGSRARSHRASL